jgi:uncharacterized membrane protein YcaP (DUF421 family)
MDLVLRTTAIFFVIFFMTRVIGRRELGSLEPFDLILLVVIGDLVQQGVTQNDYSVTGAVIVVATIALLTVAVSYVNYRVRPLRVVMEGHPVVLIENGRPIERNMRRERLTMAELAESARLQQVENLEDVRLAVLETNGNISVIPRSPLRY